MSPFNPKLSTRQYAVPVPSEYVMDIPTTLVQAGGRGNITLKPLKDFALTSLTPQFRDHDVHKWSDFVLESLKVGRDEQLQSPIDLGTHSTVLLMNTRVPTSLAVTLVVRNKKLVARVFAAALHGTVYQGRTEQLVSVDPEAGFQGASVSPTQRRPFRG